MVRLESTETPGLELQVMLTLDGKANVCIMTNGHFVEAITVSRADLIKAIWPEGVEALRDMVRYLDNNGKESDVSDIAREALAMLEVK